MKRTEGAQTPGDTIGSPDDREKSLEFLTKDKKRVRNR